MLSLDPLVDNKDSTLEDVYKKIIPECEEIRVATGYFYLSGFDLIKDDLANLRDPDDMERAPFRILMGRQTDQRTSDEIEAGKSLREQFREELKEDISELNNAQVERLDNLREFIASGRVNVRVRNPEQGYFHAKGASFRAVPEESEEREGDIDRRAAATVVGSSNFSQSGHRHNIELNLTSQERSDAEAFERWFDHGGFNIDGEQMVVYGIDSESDLYLSKSFDNGQLTLPRRSPWPREALFERIVDGEIQRTSPVRGPP